MNACMHDYAKKTWKKQRDLSLQQWSLRVTTLFGKDYGLNCTCNKGSTKVPKLQPPF